MIVLIDLEALHHFIYDGIGVVEAQFVYRSACFPDLKVSFLGAVFQVIPCFVCRIGVFPLPDVVFEDSLFVEDNKFKVYCLNLG